MIRIRVSPSPNTKTKIGGTNFSTMVSPGAPCQVPRRELVVMLVRDRLRRSGPDVVAFDRNQLVTSLTRVPAEAGAHLSWLLVFAGDSR